MGNSNSNQNSNSNSITRRWAMGKAALLVLMPMVFAVLGTTLVNQTSSVDSSKISLLEKEIAAMKMDRQVFLESMAGVDAVWNIYQKIQQEWLDSGDSLSSGKKVLKIAQQKKELSDQLNHLEISLRDTVFKETYLVAINNFRALITNYDQQVKDKETLKKCWLENGASHDLLAQIGDLEKENLALTEKYLQALKPGSGDCSKLQWEIKQLESQLRDKKEELKTWQYQYEKMKTKNQDMAVMWDKSLLGAKKKIQDFSLDCTLKVGCNNKFKEDKNNIIHFLAEEQLNIPKP